MMRRTVRIGCFSCPEGLLPAEGWAREARSWIRGAAIDVLITSELPFGDWPASSNRYDPAAAGRLKALHEGAVGAFAGLEVPVVITSLAAAGSGRLHNQATLISGGSKLKLHAKRHLPEESGWYEQSWFDAGTERPQVIEAGGMRVGALLCTEAMFPEDARALGRDRVELIAVPRATGENVMWEKALGMVAISSGAFVVSANRAGGIFSGGASVFAPDGSEVEPISESGTFSLFELDLSILATARDAYPRYLFSSGVPAAEAVAA